MTDRKKDIFAVVPQNEYDNLICRIDNLWTQAKNRAVEAVNTELLDANWKTGQYIVEFEQNGQIRAEYGKFLITRLAKDLTIRKGKGFSRSNLIYMRKFYLYFPKGVTLSHLLSWSHYYELLKCEDEMERQFYYHEAVNQKWKVRELRRQIKSSLFQRLALSTDKKGVLTLAHQGHPIQTPEDIIHDPFVLEFTGLEQKKRYKETDLEKALLDKMENSTDIHIVILHNNTSLLVV